MRNVKKLISIVTVAVGIWGGALAAEEITVATGQTFIENIFNPAKAALHNKDIIEPLAKVYARS